MYQLEYTTKFRREYKLLHKRGYNMALLQNAISTIANKKPLPAKNKAHKLSGNFNDCWECHIQPDWLLIYHVSGGEITFTRTGTHSDLFKDK